MYHGGERLTRVGMVSWAWDRWILEKVEWTTRCCGGHCADVATDLWVGIHEDVHFRMSIRPAVLQLPHLGILCCVVTGVNPAEIRLNNYSND